MIRASTASVSPLANMPRPGKIVVRPLPTGPNRASRNCVCCLPSSARRCRTIARGAACWVVGWILISSRQALGDFFASSLAEESRPQGGDTQMCLDGKTLRGTIPLGESQRVHSDIPS